MLSSHAEATLGIRAGCSSCDYVRTFAEDLNGMFYRCPRCREGAIAVGGLAATAALPTPPPSSHDVPSPLRAEKTETEKEKAKPSERPPERPRSGTVRRLLVECDVCKFLVAIQPELFGKTVRCPECRADNLFTESSLEPVKDEIEGRLALQTLEQRPKPSEPPGPPPDPSPSLDDLAARERRKRVLVAVAIVAITIAAAVVHAYFRPHLPGQSSTAK